MRLRPSTIRWIIRSGGIPHETHTSEDFPRELIAHGLVTRDGPGMLGHTHVLRGTEKGREFDLEVADAALSRLRPEQRCVLSRVTCNSPSEDLVPLVDAPDVVYERHPGRLRLTAWGMHLAWRARAIESAITGSHPS